MRFWSYLLQRLGFVVPILLGVTIVVFVISHVIPGDPAHVIAGMYANEAQVQRLREEFGLDRLERQTCIDDIGAGQSEMNEPRSVTDAFAGCLEEGDDIVVGFALDLLHSLKIARSGADLLNCPIWYAAPAVPRFADRKLNAQPAADLEFVAPDPPHLWPGIAADQ